jgi:hypothetical protein
MNVIAKAMVAAGSVDDLYAIRAVVGKALPNPGDKYPNELFGIAENGVTHCASVIRTVENGKFSKVNHVFSFPKTKEEFEKYKVHPVRAYFLKKDEIKARYQATSFYIRNMHNGNKCYVL